MTRASITNCSRGGCGSCDSRDIRHNSYVQPRSWRARGSGGTGHRSTRGHARSTDWQNTTSPYAYPAHHPYPPLPPPPHRSLPLQSSVYGHLAPEAGVGCQHRVHRHIRSHLGSRLNHHLQGNERRSEDMEQAPWTLVPLEARDRGHLGDGDLAQRQQGIRWPYYPQKVMANAIAGMGVARAPGNFRSSISAGMCSQPICKRRSPNSL